MKTVQSKYKSESSYILLTNEEYANMVESKEITKTDKSGNAYDNYFQRYRVIAE